MSIAISALAILMAVLKLPGFAWLRLFLVLLALGAGQIHMAVVSIILFLAVENGYRLPYRVPQRLGVLLFGFVALVVLLTLSSGVSGRKLFELFQLGIYVLIFLQFAVWLENAGEFEGMLSAMVAAATVVSLLGIAMSMTGFSEEPHIFLARGANEGSLFLLLMGVLPALTLFTLTRNPIFLVCVLILIAGQVVATSRSSISLSLLLVSVCVFFLLRSYWLRMLVVLVLLGILVDATPLLQVALEGQVNYSVLQRAALYQAGMDLWQEWFWLGWGWGSTSELAPMTSLTEHIYPHFHSTYVQFVVELGFMGLLTNLAWVLGFLACILIVVFGRWGSAASATYIAGASVCLLGSGFTDALIFGADRAVQVILLLSMVRAMFIGEAANRSNVIALPLESRLSARQAP